MSIQFDIQVTLFDVPDAPGADAAGLRAELQSALSTIWPALGLPAEPVVSVSLSSEPFELFEFSLKLDSQPVPVPVYQPEHSETNLSFRVMAAIFDNRTRLINVEQMRELRRHCMHAENLSATAATAPLSMWQAQAELLLHNGFSLSRLGACLEYWKPGVQPVLAFEQLIESLENLQLRLVINPVLAKNDTSWETRLPDFYRELYQELGILLPKIVLDTDKTLLTGQFRLQLNDQMVPVQPYAAVLNESDGPALSNVADHIMHWLRYWTRRCAGWFINTTMLEALMDKLEDNNRSLLVMIREQWPQYRLCRLMRQLLDERISIQNLAEVLDVLLRIDGPVAIDDTEYMPYFPPVSRVVVVPPGAVADELTDAQLAGQVRANLKFPVVFPHMKGGVLPCYTLDPPLLRDFREGFFRESFPRPGNALYRLLQLVSLQGDAPVFLVPSGIRPEVVSVLRPYFPEMAVIGHEEVPSFFVPSVQATLTLP